MPHFENGHQVTESKLELTSVELSFSKSGWLGRRSTLEKVLLILLGVLFIAVLVLAIIVGVNSMKEKEETEGVTIKCEKSHNETERNVRKENETGPPTPRLYHICTTTECAHAASRIMTNLDTRINPCDDFFEFACGTWRRKNVIPEDRSSLDTFGVLRDEVEVILKYLLEEPIDPKEPKIIERIKNFYISCMNMTLIKERNISVAYPLLEELGGWPILGSKPGGNWNESQYSLTDLLVTLMKYNNNPLIQMYVYTDVKNSTVRIIYLDQPGFGMPGQKYYLKGRNDPMVKAYEQFATSIAIAFGADESTAIADMKEMVDLETDIANISMPSEDRRDSEALYNKITLGEMSVNFTVPVSLKFNWTEYLTNILLLEGVNITTEEDEPIVIRAIPYFEKLFPLLTSKYSNRAIANYLVWRIMQNRVYNLDDSFQDLINKYNKVVYGTEVPRARWRKCASYVNSNMGLALGRLFVKEVFDNEAKKDTEEMIRRLTIAFKKLLTDVNWMDDETRELARDKANYIKQKIGYQESILNDKELDEAYENYTAASDKYFENVLGVINRISIDSLRLLRDEVNKTWWTTAPATVNAYYNSVLNRIMFPAGILQPPFYGKYQPKSMNYGAIGVIIGHEITHGFDDRGRAYDKYGNLEQWWSDEAIAKFKTAKTCIVDQYGNFKVPEADNMTMNGINTQGENIADNGGLKQSYKAYRQWVNERGKEEARLPGIKYDHNQIFFISFAQIWCANMRREDAINRIRTGVHSPGRFRVTGTLQNSADFSKAFNCPAGSKMNPNKKCAVW